jgi:hypothetical protein
VSESVSLNMRVAPPVHDALTKLAADLHLSKTAVVRRALGVLQDIETEKRLGRYVGATRDRECLETVIATPL